MRFQCARCAPKQGKRLTYPPVNENGWTNSDNSLLNDKSLLLGVGYIRHYNYKLKMKVMQVISEIQYIPRDAGLQLHAPRYKNLLIGALKMKN